MNLADGTTTVRCLGPAHSLAPGQACLLGRFLQPYMHLIQHLTLGSTCAPWCPCWLVSDALRVVLQAVDVVMYLENPYPKEGKVEVLNMTTQIVDGNGTPVALSDASPPPSTCNTIFISLDNLTKELYCLGFST